MNSTALKLKTYFEKGKFVFVDKDTVFSGGVLAKDGAKYTELTIKELITGHDITWNDTGQRQSKLDKAGKLSHNRNTPIFKAPTGDTPHVHFPNVINTQFQSKGFPEMSGPFTSIVFFRPRRSVQWEGGIGLTVRMRNRGDAMSIDNTNGEVTLDKGLPVYDRWNLLIMEVNGVNTRAKLNGQWVGGNKTLSATKIRALYYGTPSHVQEHDLKYAVLLPGLLTDAEHAEILKLSKQIIEIDSLPTKPVITNIRIKQTEKGFALSGYDYHSPNGLPIGSVEVEWIQIDGGNLETQKFVGTGFDLEIPKANQMVAAIVTVKDRDGKSYPGIPFRSEFLKD